MYKLHKNVLPDYSFSLLKKINETPSFDQFYLVGGTALALQLGHRISVDLDFFSQSEFSSSIIHFLPKPEQVVSLHDNSIETIIDQTKIFFLYYAFPRKNDLLVIDRIKMAHPVDIGLMKLIALQGRTTRKDIVDLFFIDKEVIKLEVLFDIFENFYPKESFSSYDSLKTLIDVEHLKNEPMPRMLVEFDWDAALDFVSSKISKHIRKIVG